METLMTLLSYLVFATGGLCAVAFCLWISVEYALRPALKSLKVWWAFLLFMKGLQ